MKNLFIFVIVLLSVACSRNYDTTVVIDSEDCVTSSYSLKEQAKQSVQEMLNKLDPPTRGFARTVASVEVITYGELFGEDAHTRTDSIEWNFQPTRRYYNPALLLANFTNNNGYAILHPILDEDGMVGELNETDTITVDTTFEFLAIADSGAMSSNQILSAWNNNTTTNTNNDTTLEDIYVEEDDDYLIGGEDPEEYVAYLATNYVNRCFQHDGTSIYRAATNVSGLSLSKEPLLKTKWNQGKSYNKYFPVYNDQELYNAGCTTIATAQILTYLKDVSLVEKFGIYLYTWEQFEAASFPSSSYSMLTLVADSATKMIKKVADGIGVSYSNNENSATATARKVKRYLESLGYSVEKKNGTNLSQKVEDIVTSLRFNKPVFMSGFRNAYSGHSWVLDGFMHNSECLTDDCIDSYYLHCNFGWGGKSDGWYFMDLFNNETNIDELLDGGEGSLEQNFEYDKYFRFIFFNN